MLKSSIALRLLYVDDSSIDRSLMALLLTGGEHPWLRKVTIVSAATLPPHADLFRDYDGVILDERQGQATGHEQAAQIHAHSSGRFSILILTGSPELLPANVREYVDAVSGKQLNTSGNFDPFDPLQVFRAWVRGIARAKEQGSKAR